MCSASESFSLSVKSYVLVAEILSVTNCVANDRRNPFKVVFDDPSWSCLCKLANKIGFAGNVVSQYSLSSQI